MTPADLIRDHAARIHLAALNLRPKRHSGLLPYEKAVQISKESVKLATLFVNELPLECFETDTPRDIPQPPASEVAEAMKIAASASMPACPKCGSSDNVHARYFPSTGCYYCAKHACEHFFTPPPRDADAGATKPDAHRRVGTLDDLKANVAAEMASRASPDPLAAVREFVRAACRLRSTGFKSQHIHDGDRFLVGGPEYRAFVDAVDAVNGATLRLLPPGHVAVPREVAKFARGLAMTTQVNTSSRNFASRCEQVANALSTALKETP